ncbi:MAG: GAF domain-containing sensor histidine kinase, partial [Chloroflexota bacterium]
PAPIATRPLRGPDGHVGELCVTRAGGPPFDTRETDLLRALADMAAVAVRTAQLREAENQMVTLAERDRIAREMHDSLAQVLGVIHLQLRSIAGTPEVSEGPVGVQLDELADVADEAYRDVREAILGLRETISADKGLEGTLRDYLAKYSRQTGISARLVCALSPDDVLPPRSEVQLLRVVQEALTNVRKHAGASSVVVRLEDDGHGPVLSVEDDGSGFDPQLLAESMSGGFGLASMRERVDQVGGNLDIETAPGQGTRIIVRFVSGDSRGSPAATLSTTAGRRPAPLPEGPREPDQRPG